MKYGVRKDRNAQGSVEAAGKAAASTPKQRSGLTETLMGAGAAVLGVGAATAAAIAFSGCADETIKEAKDAGNAQCKVETTSSGRVVGCVPVADGMNITCKLVYKEYTEAGAPVPDSKPSSADGGAAATSDLGTPKGTPTCVVVKPDAGVTPDAATGKCDTPVERDSVKVLLTNVEVNGEPCKIATGCEGRLTVGDKLGFGTKSPKKTGKVSSIDSSTISITMDNSVGTVNVDSAATGSQSGCQLEVSGSDPEPCANALKGDIKYTPNTPVKNDVSTGVRVTAKVTDKTTGKSKTVLLEQGTAASDFQVGESVVKGLTAVDGVEGNVTLKATLVDKYGKETVLGGKNVSAKGSTTLGDLTGEYVTITAAGVSDANPVCVSGEKFVFTIGATGETATTRRLLEGEKLVDKDGTVVLTVKMQASLKENAVDTSKPYYAAVLKDGKQMAVLAKGETATIEGTGLDVSFVGVQ